MSRILKRQLIGHEDLALGFGKVSQTRGDQTLEFRQIQLEFIFETTDEIREIDYNRYLHVALHHDAPHGPVSQYYWDPYSLVVDDDYNVIRPNRVVPTQAGRYIRVIPNYYGLLDTIIASASDEVTPLEVGTKLTTFRAPYPLTLQYVRCSLSIEPAATELIVDVRATGTSIFATPMHIDVGERTSVTAVTQPILSIVNIVDDTEFFVDVLQGDVQAAGLKVAVTGTKVV